MKKLITLCTLLFCNTMFAPGNTHHHSGEEESEDCIKCYKCCLLTCGLMSAYCCAPAIPNKNIAPRTIPTPPKPHDKMQ